MLIAAMYAFAALIYGVCVGVTGFAFADVMANLDGPHQKYYFNIIEKAHPWIYKPLGGCAQCFSGQLALWTSLFLVWGFDPVFPCVAAICVACGSAITTSYALTRLN